MEREVQQFRYNLTKPLVVYRPKKKGNSSMSRYPHLWNLCKMCIISPLLLFRHDP